MLKANKGPSANEDLYSCSKIVASFTLISSDSINASAISLYQLSSPSHMSDDN
jgi:hypothetical protein